MPSIVMTEKDGRNVSWKAGQSRPDDDDDDDFKNLNYL